MPREITFENKESIITKEVPRKNKCTAEDLNEIKEVVNENAQNLVTVSSTEPTGNNKNKVWFKKGKNLYNSTLYPLIQNRHYDASGNVLNWNNYRGINNYMPIQPSTTYVQSNSLNLSIARVCFYDAGCNFLSASTSNSFTTPNNCKYIRFSVYSENNTIPTWLQIEQGSTATTSENYIEPKIYTKNNNNMYEEFTIKENQTYLTGETVAGTFMGKPLYRNIVQMNITTSGTSGTWKYDYSSTISNNIDLIFIKEATAILTDLSNRKMPFPIIFANTNRIIISSMGNTLEVSNNSTHYGFATIVVEYTKTTD